MYVKAGQHNIMFKEFIYRYATNYLVNTSVGTVYASVAYIILFWLLTKSTPSAISTQPLCLQQDKTCQKPYLSDESVHGHKCASFNISETIETTSFRLSSGFWNSGLDEKIPSCIAALCNPLFFESFANNQSAIYYTRAHVTPSCFFYTWLYQAVMT